MGELLFDHWLAPQVKRLWGRCFPGGEADARTLVTLICVAHDIGKASPSFSCQVDSLADRARGAGLACDSLAVLAETRKHQPHAAVSDYAARTWLVEAGMPRGLAEQVGSILGAHHGRPASTKLVAAMPTRPQGIGGPEWKAVRDELMAWAARESGVLERLTDWGSVSLPMSVQVGMTGLLIMADWISSNQEYFPLRRLVGHGGPTLDADESRWRDGWDAVALPGPWVPAEPEVSGLELYRTRFGWPASWTLSAVQTHVAERAAAGDVGLMIIEAAMGAGKTEAALVASELLAAAKGSQGVLIALPTQATTNAMFGRVRPWVERQPSTFADGVPWSIVLGHGKAALNPIYVEMVEQVREIDEQCRSIDGLYDEVGETATDVDGMESARAIAHQWFNGRKRRLLHNFVVSTIDQLLMAGTRTKHQMLNHLALAGKVVVVDEAHASDSYMNSFLDALLPWLGEYGAPVIVLSATLAPARRQALVDAYCGRPTCLPETAADEYPLVTTVSVDRVTVDAVHCPDATPSRAVSWDWLEADDAAIIGMLREAMPDGGCSLVIRNTVRAAQATVAAIEAAGLGPVTLTHSRFLAVDRAAREAELVERFGPGATLENGRRPPRHIVVATQVVEQSLDVDFDLLITDLAPIDLLFQRAGRLHRHPRTRPAGMEKPRIHLLRDPTSSAGSPPRADRGSHVVYGDHLLLRTSAVLEQHGLALVLPDDIAPLVARALGEDPIGRPEWEATLAAADREHAGDEARRRDRAQPFVLAAPQEPGRRTATMATWLVLPHDGSDEAVAALVRDTDPSVEVIVVPFDPDGHVIAPPWWGGQPLDVRTPPDRMTALMISSWTLRLPPQLTRSGDDLDRVIQRLQEQESVRHWSWRENPLLKGELFLPMRQTDEGSEVLETSLFEGFGGAGILRYSPQRGLEVMDRE